jgi:exonuclease SbcD
MSMPVTQKVGAVEAVAPPFVAKLMDMELEEPSAVPEAFPVAAVEPVAPVATASAPMNWLTDDLFA